MKANRDLFLLVESLSQHEKRYLGGFLLSQNQGSESHSLQLFNWIKQHSGQSEKWLKTNCPEPDLQRQWAVYKHICLNNLLRGLEAYNHANSPVRMLRSCLDRIEIYFEKGLQEQAQHQLEKATEICEDHGLSTYLHVLHEWRRRLSRQQHTHSLWQHIDELEAAGNQINAQVQHEFAAGLIYDQLYAMLQHDRRAEAGDKAAKSKDLGLKLADLEEKMGKSFSCQSALLSAKALFYHNGGDYDNMRKTYEALLGLWAEHPKVMAAFPAQHARIQSAWLNSLVTSGQTGSNLAEVRALRRIPLKANEARARLVFQSYNIELLWWMEKGDLKKASNFLEEFRTRLQELSKLLDPTGLMVFQLNAAIVYFQRQSFKMASEWAEKIAGAQANRQAIMLMHNAALLSCICHLELGDIDAAEKQSKATMRLIKYQMLDWPFGMAVLKGIGQVLKSENLQAEKKAYVEMQQSLLALDQNPVPILQASLLQWLDARIRALS